LSQWLKDTPGAGLLLLRAFLGVTFTFAALQKLANPGFFQAGTPGSIQQQLLGADRTSPISGLVSVALHQPVLVGVLIAVCELLVGLATLAGLLARPAAALGALISLTFFLTVSFHTSPYYYGSDIVFLFAWTPFILVGAGALSLDERFARRRAAAVAAQGSGGGKQGSTRRPAVAPERSPEVERRTAVGVLAGTAVVLGGAAALIGRALSPKGASAGTSPTLPTGNGTGSTGSTTTTPGGTGSTTTTSTAASTGNTGSSGGGNPKGTLIGPAKDVPVGGAAGFTDPASGNPAYALQPTAGHFTAFSAVCTHAGCTVAFDKASFTFNCPCHGSRYDAANGSVLQGPAAAPLPAIPIAEGSNGQLYADG
jgi:thiosulfate dehydrogenase [quinone] large subunit